MNSEHISLSVDVNADAATVFQKFTDWPSQGEWMFGTTVHTTGAGTQGWGKGEGAEISAFTGWFKIGFWDTMRITKWEAPQRVDVLHTGKIVRGTGTMIVESVTPTTSRFIWSEELELPFGALGRFGFKIVRPLFVAGVRHSLEKFATWVAATS
ncbi:MAG: hypothetical protein RLZZ426_836 [Actinomycetota bacterium]|jgi:hypothetical protein